MLTLIVADIILFAIFYYHFLGSDASYYTPEQNKVNKTWQYVSGILFIIVTLWITTMI